MTSFGGQTEREEQESPDLAKCRPVCELDPGWVLSSLARRQDANPLELVANGRWWPSTLASGSIGEILNHLWRHSAATALAARFLARDSGDADPDEVARAGLLSRVGCWAMAAV